MQREGRDAERPGEGKGKEGKRGDGAPTGEIRVRGGTRAEPSPCPPSSGRHPRDLPWPPLPAVRGAVWRQGRAWGKGGDLNTDLKAVPVQSETSRGTERKLVSLLVSAPVTKQAGQFAVLFYFVSVYFSSFHCILLDCTLLHFLIFYFLVFHFYFILFLFFSLLTLLIFFFVIIICLFVSTGCTFIAPSYKVLFSL